MSQSLEILNVFNTLKQIFWKTETIFKKREYRFLVESTKTENASFSYKTAISEANFKTDGMVSKKWTYHRERNFASNYFIFWRFCVSISYNDLIWYINPNIHIRTFCKRWSFVWRRFFYVSIFK